MTSRSVLLAFTFLLATGAAAAETVEVRMLNRGAGGSMVFEPDFVALQPGDTIQFRVGSRSHNAASIAGMAPAGATSFKGQIDEEITVRLDTPGFYGIKCSPHLGMGMVMVVKVGAAELPAAFVAEALPARAKARFGEILERAGLGKPKP